MTIKRAIEVLQEFIDIDKELIGDGEPESDFDKFVAERDEACRMAIETMGLRIAKKPEYRIMTGYICPYCYSKVTQKDDEKFSFCECGQKIDWR